MTGKSFEISVDAMHADTSTNLLSEIQRQLVEGLVTHDREEMDRLVNGRWPEDVEPRISVYEEPIDPRGPREDNIGLFQQQAPTWGTSVTPPDNMSGDRARLKRMFADKLNTHAPEPKPETQVVPRRNGKRTAAAKAAGNAAVSAQAGAGIAAAQASAHTHTLGKAMGQGKLQAAALNIGGRDVKECTDCGALVLDDVAHRQVHATTQNDILNLERQLADAREEIRELKEARTKKVPRPHSVQAREELKRLQEEVRAKGPATREELRKNMGMTYGEAVGGGILQPRSFVDMKLHVGES